jgi:ribosomal protein S8
MFTANSLANTLATIKNAYRAQKLYTEIPYCRANSLLLARLQEVGYVQSYIITPAVGFKPTPRLPTARVYLKYVQHTPLYSSVVCYWRQRSPLVVSWRALAYANKSRPFMVFLVSTDRGLLTSGECVSQRRGGSLVCGLFAFL